MRVTAERLALWPRLLVQCGKPLPAAGATGGAATAIQTGKIGGKARFAPLAAPS